MKGESYGEFVEKFKPKLTTDDCYTPQWVYDVVLGWVRKEYGIGEETRIMRPFRPGGDYQAEDYNGDAVVVDNPPFSIITAIVDWYVEHNVRFFLFAPALTLLSATRTKACAIICSADVVYENGAAVRTSFATNLDDENVLAVCPELKNLIEAETKRVKGETREQLPKYEYPDSVISAATAQRICTRGEAFKIRKADAVFIHQMDAQRAKGKKIFGGGLLLNERASAERASAERASAERASAEGHVAVRWEISEREKQMMAGL